MKSIKLLILFFIYLFISNNLVGQSLGGFIKSEVDSNYINIKEEIWTLRAFSTVKSQEHVIRNLEGDEVKLVPNDRFSTGLGFSYKSLIVDLGFRLQFEDLEKTERFDLQGEAIINQHIIDVNIQRYKGFSRVENNQEESFRDDILSWVLGFNYLYNFNHKRISIRTETAGNRYQKRFAGTFLLGGFGSFHVINADSSIISPGNDNFNGSARFSDNRFINIGVKGGYAFVTPLFWRFFLLGGIVPGVGLNFGVVEAEENYRTPTRATVNLNIRASLGYIGKRWYTGVNYLSDSFVLDMGNDNLFQYNVGKLKLVIGYTFNSKNTVIEEVLGE